MELFPILERRNKLNDNLWYVLSPTNNVQVGDLSNEVNSGGEVRLVFWSVAKADWLILITCQKNMPHLSTRIQIYCFVT